MPPTQTSGRSAFASISEPQTEADLYLAHPARDFAQTDEALRCYDRAIELNSALTIAYLQKGGLFNRMERYEEALQCYELALRAQEKAHHA